VQYNVPLKLVQQAAIAAYHAAYQQLTTSVESTRDGDITS
jgi:hypothetical protein